MKVRKGCNANPRNSAKGTLFLLILFAAAGSWGMTFDAWAHRDRGPNDPCRKQIGDSLLHMTLYQPQFDPDAEYCEEVPRTGKAIMVVDVTPGELRQTPISLEVVADSDVGQPHTVLSVPAKVYARGVADTEVVLNEEGDYIARVVLQRGANQEPELLSFPIRVTAWYKALIMPTLLVIGVLAFIVISVIRYQITGKQQESSVGRVNVRRVAH